MPKYNILIDTDAAPDRESGVQKAVQDHNNRLEEGSPELSAEQYLQLVVDVAVDSYAKQFLQEETRVISLKFERASDVERMNVKDALAAIPVI